MELIFTLTILTTIICVGLTQQTIRSCSSRPRGADRWEFNFDCQDNGEEGNAEHRHLIKKLKEPFLNWLEGTHQENRNPHHVCVKIDFKDTRPNKGCSFDKPDGQLMSIIAGILGALNIILLVALITTIIICKRRNRGGDKPSEKPTNTSQFDSPVYKDPDHTPATAPPHTDTKSTRKAATETDAKIYHEYEEVPHNEHHADPTSSRAEQKKDVSGSKNINGKVEASHQLDDDGTEMVQNAIYESDQNDDGTEMVQNVIYQPSNP